MNGGFNLRMIPLFDGAGSVVEWTEKMELVCRLCKMKRLEHVIPLRLTGGVFAVYQKLRREGGCFDTCEHLRHSWGNHIFTWQNQLLISWGTYLHLVASRSSTGQLIDATGFSDVTPNTKYILPHLKWATQNSYFLYL